jgi:hypothetical protein
VHTSPSGGARAKSSALGRFGRATRRARPCRRGCHSCSRCSPTSTVAKPPSRFRRGDAPSRSRPAPKTSPRLHLRKRLHLRRRLLRKPLRLRKRPPRTCSSGCRRVGWLPRAAIRTELGLRVVPSRRFSFGLDTGAVVPRRHPADERSGAEAWGWVGALSGCGLVARTAIRVGFCGGVEGGWLRLRGYRVEVTRRADAAHAAGLAVARMTLPLGAWFVELELGAAVPILRQRFTVTEDGADREFFRSAPVTLRAGVRVGLRSARAPESTTTPPTPPDTATTAAPRPRTPTPSTSTPPTPAATSPREAPSVTPPKATSRVPFDAPMSSCLEPDPRSAPALRALGMHPEASARARKHSAFPSASGCPMARTPTTNHSTPIVDQAFGRDSVRIDRLRPPSTSG